MIPCAIIESIFMILLGGTSMEKSTITEKIQELLDWNKQYPLVQVTSQSKDSLKNYCTSEKEYKDLLEKLKRMQKHYDYLRHRKWQGALTPEQEELCKEGNVRGVFGYPHKTQALSQKYRINPAKIDYILSKYGSMENYIAVYRADNLDKQDLDILGDNLVDLQIDINSGHLEPGLSRLAQIVLGSSPNHKGALRVFDSNKILEALSSLTDTEANIISFRFGLDDNISHTLDESGRNFGMSREKVRQLENKAIRRLRHPSRVKSFSVLYDDSLIEEQSISPEVKSKRDSILDRIYNSNIIFVPDSDFSLELDDITSSELRDMASELCAIQEKQHRESILEGEVPTDGSSIPDIEQLEDSPNPKPQTELEQLKLLRILESRKVALLKEEIVKSEERLNLYNKYLNQNTNENLGSRGE